MRAWLLALVVGSTASAQAVEEFALPAFAADAGVPDEPEGADAGVPSAPPLLPPPAPVRPPPPRWARVGGSLSLLFTGLTQVFLGGEVTLLGTLAGTPAPSTEALGEAEGWLFQAGVQGGWGRVGAPQCRGSAFCATRAFGGVSFKGGWARGTVSLVDGVTRAQTMYFGQLDVDAAHFDIESAPLSPGRRTWELLTRLRAGLQWTSANTRATTTGVTLLGAAVVEAIPVSDGTQTVSLGFSLGLGF